MNYLRENRFSAVPFDRNFALHHTPAVRVVFAAPPPTWDAAVRLLSLLARTPQGISGFRKLDGGYDPLASTEGAAFLHGGRLTLLLCMHPGPTGFPRQRFAGRNGLEPAVWVHFDFKHDHFTGMRFHVSRNGKASACRVWGCEGVLASTSQEGVEGNVRSGWSVRSAKTGGRWVVRLSLDLRRFGLSRIEERPTIGFCVSRMHDMDGHAEETSWPLSRIWRPIPPTYGHLLLADAPVIVQSLDLRNPIHGMNRTVLDLLNTSRKPLRVVCNAQTVAPSLRSVNAVDHILRPGKATRVRLPYETSPLDWADQTVEFTVRTPDRLAYAATYRAGACYARKFGGSYLQLKHRLPAGVPRGLPPPDSWDREYYPKKRFHILSNMPDFSRDPRAPMQFIIGKAHGRKVVRFDLTRAGFFRRIGRHLESLFDTDDDRLIAAMYFVHQTNTWDGAFNAVLATSNPATMLRVGYLLCGDYALLLAAVLACITERRTGKPFSAHYCCASNHVICAVDRGRDHVLVDPNLGFFFPSHDNRRLATARELFHDPSLVRRVVPGRLKDYEISNRIFLGRSMANFPVGAPPA